MLLILLLGLLLKVFSTVLRIGDAVTPLLPVVIGALKPGKNNAYNLMKNSGYPMEIHGNLVTEDGYILEMHRIPYSPKNSTQKGRTPVLLLHGLMSSSADWLIVGPERSIAYMLADQGYDVWMGNVRGNAYSRRHRVYTPAGNGKKFWNFSFHQIGIYDLPVMIDYVLNTTGKDQLHGVGHSQGTVSFLVLLSEKPEYNEKIRMLNLFAPICYMKHVSSEAGQLLAPYAEQLEKVVWDDFKLYEFIQKSIFLETLAKLVCYKHSPLSGLCPLLLFSVVGFNPEQYDKDISTAIFTNLPSGSSLKQFLHFAQLIDSGRFRHYDHFKKNMIHYGQTSPPDYNITNIVAPIGLHYAKNDLLSSPIDVGRLKKELPNVVIDNLIPEEKFNHMDFLFALDIEKLLYNDVVANMTRY